MKKGVVLLNMGGPSNLEEVPLFLRNMFNDKNILPIPFDFIRGSVAKFITNKRTPIAKENYTAIGGKSPLLGHTKKLLEILSYADKETYYTCAMRYVPPFADEAIEELRKRGIQEVRLFPMYPQYSTTTTLSSVQDFMERCAALDYKPKIDVIHNYYYEQGYNEAIIERITESLAEKKADDFVLIFSAHGLPQRVVDKGDPYQKEVEKNIEILKEMCGKEGLNFESIMLAYQSKVGPMRWLEPSLEEVLAQCKGKNVCIYPISFTVDNSETDFELSIEYKEKAQKLGIQEYVVAKCLNDNETFAKTIIELTI